MSYVEKIRYRLLIEQLQQWVERLSGKEPLEPEAVKELAVRLLAMALMLLKQHSVNKRGNANTAAGHAGTGDSESDGRGARYAVHSTSR